MKTRYFPDVIAIAFMAFTAVATLLVYDHLPPTMATHFDLHGQANGWMQRVYGASVMPAAAFLLWAMLRFARVILPAPWRARVEGSPLSTLACVTGLFLSALHLLILEVALHGGSSLGRGLALLMGGMWIALALLLPRVRRNPLIGVRTAWSLTSDENWARTHRVASYTFAAGGVIALVEGLVGGSSATAVALVAVVVSSLFPAVYSYVLARSTT